jgi:SAM-dependent methyltransferase
VDKEIVSSTAAFFEELLGLHGATPKAVDWNSDEAQTARFAQVLKVVEERERFSLNDVGCGYGALVGFLDRAGYAFDYCGTDISAAMIEKARELHGGRENVVFHEGSAPPAPADYSVACGIFNKRMHFSEERWGAFVRETVAAMARSSRRGMAFNMLTKYSDPEKMREDLYYPDPCEYFDWCKREFSRRVALLHDYPLYEFTLIVRF